MATVAETLKSAYEALAVKYATAVAAAGPTYSIDGQSVNRMEYLAGLSKEMETIRGQLIAAEGPIEFETQGQV